MFSWIRILILKTITCPLWRKNLKGLVRSIFLGQKAILTCACHAQVCKNGKCVVDNENIIPDYTHVTRSVVNRVDKEVAKASTTSRPASSKPQVRPHSRRQQHRPTYPRNSNTQQPKKDPPPAPVANKATANKGNIRLYFCKYLFCSLSFWIQLVSIWK